MRVIPSFHSCCAAVGVHHILEICSPLCCKLGIGENGVTQCAKCLLENFLRKLQKDSMCMTEHLSVLCSRNFVKCVLQRPKSNEVLE